MPARSSHARDSAAALNAFDDLLKKGMVLSERSTATIRDRIEALRGSEEQAVLTPELRDAIVAWLDVAAAAVELWPLDPFDFSAIAAQLAVGLSQRAQAHSGRLDAGERREPAFAAPARRRSCATRWN